VGGGSCPCGGTDSIERISFNICGDGEGEDGFQDVPKISIYETEIILGQSLLGARRRIQIF